MNKFLPYAHQSIDSQDLKQVEAALQGDLITRGPFVDRFEEALKEKTGAEYCVVLNSGSSALDAAYFAAEGQESDRILSTPNTFISTVGAGVKRGMHPVFLDIDRSTGNIQTELVLANLEFPSSRGKLFFVPVHFSGIAMDMKAIFREIKDPKTVIIEDGAHALGSLYPSGEKVGSCRYSDMTIFSFHPAKILTTGEGGAVLTNNEAYYKRLKLYRNNGIVRKDIPWHYDVEALTGNFQFTEFQAALGLSQLGRLDAFIEKRRRLVKKYRQNLSGVSGIRLFSDIHDERTAFHLFVIQVDCDKTSLMEKLKQQNIGSQYHYVPLYRQPVFEKSSGDIREYFPEMEGYYQSALSLPLYSDLTEKEVDYISETLLKVLAVR